MHFFQFLGQSRVVGIGGKGVGKSTMLRYIANRLIQECGQILWIDLDPGQAEFTIPGTFYSRNICIFGNSGVVIFCHFRMLVMYFSERTLAGTKFHSFGSR